MLFNSFEFLVFFPFVTILYFLLPHKFRWFHLLAASCYFYMAFVPIYILILGFTIVIDYYAGLYIEKTEGKKRKLILVLSLISNIGILAVFKYYNFFNDNLSGILTAFGKSNPVPYLAILLPIGLSFHTFQAMSYTIEVYRGNQKPERHFGIYALYVMFYPQLVAGPIERPQNLLHQFHEKKFFNYINVTEGLKLMLWGICKKVVIADRLAQYTDPVFNHPHNYSSIALLVGAIFFSFQIFCDFSGYSDIAIGSARVMGIHLMKNFDTPFNSKNITEFWNRWHISLSTWFKDYLYTSLNNMPWYLKVFIVFLISGLWHGANWTFIVWGALHGFYLLFALVTLDTRNKLNEWTGITSFPKLFSFTQIILTFILVSFSLIFFRANSLKDAFYIISHIPNAVVNLYHIISTRNLALYNFPIKKIDIFFSFSLIFLLEFTHWIQHKFNTQLLLKQLPYLRWVLYFIMIFVTLFYGVFEKHSFIYFQF